MGKSNLKGEALIRSVEASAKGEGRFNLWWLGQSGFLMQWEGFHLLIDPLLGIPGDAGEDKNGGISDGALSVAPEALSFVEAVLCTHLHPDHFDRSALSRLLEVAEEVTIVVPDAVRSAAAEQLGCGPDRLVGLDENVSVHVGEAAVTGIGASHGQPRQDDEGRWLCLGYAIQIGPWTLYHSGDTTLYEGLAAKLQPFSVDVALVPISCHGPEDSTENMLNAKEAVRLAAGIEARLAIPHHFGAFSFEPGLTEEFRAECSRRGQMCRILRPGELWSDRELELLAQQEEEEEFGGRFRTRGTSGEEDEF